MPDAIPKDFWTVDYPRARAAAQAEIGRMKVDRNEGYNLVGWFCLQDYLTHSGMPAPPQRPLNGPVYLTHFECDTDPYGTMQYISHLFDIDSPEALALIAGEMLILTD